MTLCPNTNQAFIFNTGNVRGVLNHISFFVLNSISLQDKPGRSWFPSYNAHLVVLIN